MSVSALAAGDPTQALKLMQQKNVFVANMITWWSTKSNPTTAIATTATAADNDDNDDDDEQ